MDKEKSRSALNGLIAKYKSLQDDKEFRQNESQLIRSLLQPFVAQVLGWDIDNPSEFKVESRIRGKRSDMLICLDGRTQFVIEAKSLNQDINNNTEFINQTITYTDAKEKKFAILTNFKFFLVIRCDIKVDNPFRAVVETIDIENCSDSDFGELEMIYISFLYGK